MTILTSLMPSGSNIARSAIAAEWMLAIVWIWLSRKYMWNGPRFVHADTKRWNSPAEYERWSIFVEENPAS